METIYSLPLFKRLAPRTTWIGGRISDTDILSLSEAVRAAKKHADIDINEQDFLYAAARGEILLRAVASCEHTMSPLRETDSTLLIPNESIPTLPLDACIALANIGKAEWRHIDDFEPAEIFGGALSRFKRWELPDLEQSIFTTIEDCRITGYDVHALTDAISIDNIKNIEDNATLAEYVGNGSVIDWQHWVDEIKILTTTQACSLMSGLNPDSFKNKNSKADVTSQKKASKEMQNLAEAQGRLTSTAEQWRNWALEHNFTVHDGFSIAVHKSHKKRFDRFTLDEAAKQIADNTLAREESILEKLCEAVRKYEVPAYEPLSNLRVNYGTERGKLTQVRPFYEEVYWNDLKKWLSKTEYKLNAIGDPFNEKKPLISLAQPHLDSPFKELPLALQVRLDAEIIFKVHAWDTLNAAERHSRILSIDEGNTLEAKEDESRGWVDYTLDATFWWSLPSITPIQATMLLLESNPNEISVEQASQQTTSETNPEDFIKLQNAFESLERADNRPRKLSDWLKHARDMNLRVHSWVFAFENHFRKFSTPAAGEKSQEKHILKSDRQRKAIIDCILEKGYSPQKLPKNLAGKSGIKAQVKAEMLKNKYLFSLKSFDKAWDALRSDNEIQDN